MKFVCRQLYIESSGLLPTSPVLTFLDPKGRTECASLMCARSLSASGAQVLRDLHEINITERVPHGARRIWGRIFDLHGIHALVDFCRAHPHITVNVWLKSTSHKIWNPPSSLAREIAHVVARKVEFFDSRPELASIKDSHCNHYVMKALKEMEQVWSGFAADAPVFPDNLKMRPVGTFNEIQSFLNFKYARQGDARRMVESWYKNGF